MSELLQSGHHPDADQLNAFVEHTLPPHELEQTLAHLAVCPDCREIVALSLPPVDDLLLRPVHKPWFFRGNLVWSAAAAVTAIVFVIALVRNGITTRNSAGAPTQVAASKPPVPLQPPTEPQISNPNPPAPPDNRSQPRRHSAIPSDTAVANPAKDKTAINPRSVGGPLLQNGLPQPAPTSGTQAIHGQLRPSVNNADGFTMAPPQKAPAFPTDHFQQSPTGSSDAIAVNASGRLIQAPIVAPVPQAPNPPAPPITAPNAPVPTNQTVEVIDGASNLTLPSTTSDIQLNQARNIVTHPLPSNLPVLSMVSNAHQVLAIDTQHSLFLSDDAGNHWKAVPAQWKGRAVKVELASSTALKQLSAGTATAEAPGANFGATGGLVTTRTPITSAILTGSVTDGSGAAISNASVVVGNATTPNAGTVKTDRAGHYLIDGLIPGSYRVAAEAPGLTSNSSTSPSPPRSRIPPISLYPSVRPPKPSPSARPPKSSTSTDQRKPPRLYPSPEKIRQSGHLPANPQSSKSPSTQESTGRAPTAIPGNTTSASRKKIFTLPASSRKHPVLHSASPAGTLRSARPKENRMYSSPFQRSFRLFLPFVLLLLFAAAACSLRHARAQQLAATYTRGNLAVTIPYHSTREGSGKLTVEILDPEDNVLGRVEHSVDIAKGEGFWQQTITPERPLLFEDLVWQRIRYRFEYNANALPSIEGLESISQVLRRPVVHVLGQTQYLAGSQAAIRVIVSDANNNDVTETGTLRIELLIPDQKPRPLFSGRLNRRGTVEAQFRFPVGLTGKCEMRYVADTPIGSTEFTQDVQLDDKASILLITEKPIYQPGQTIHVRALALDRAHSRADADRKLTFELEDSRGNKVFKKSIATDKFGVASAEFALADEVNLGTYHLRALMGDASSPSNTAEVALNVERYILPKFKVAVEFTEKDNKPKRDYRPGDHVTGTVRANYFFGKPVDHAEITVKASSMDVAIFEAAFTTGKTDSDGAYRFDLKLPAYFAGRPLSQGAARALVEASVKDSAVHTETRGEPITISQSSLLITAVPEGRVLIPHLDNQVFILSSYPDGTPANTTLTVHLPGNNVQQVSTDPGGVAIIHFNPGSSVESLQVEADDHHGNRASSAVPLQTRVGTDQILLRSNRAIIKAGDRIQLKILSTRTSGPAYVDIVKNGQTILTRDLDIQNGQADLTLNATPEMAGTLDINAYLFGRDAQPVADHRLIFVQPADELKIETTTDSTVYKPGSEARIHFHVTNGHGEGVSAALGLQVVDEAVFALAEKRPGFAKVFFYLEEEVMKPRYEIHSLSMSDIVEPTDPSANDRQDLAARALFAATEIVSPAKLDTEFGRSLPQDRYADYQQRYRSAFLDLVRKIIAKLDEESDKGISQQDFITAFKSTTLDNGSQPRDAWNNPLRVEPTSWSRGREIFYRVRSAGPDHRFDSADDLTVYIENSGSVVNQPGRGGSLDLKIEHDRGPLNELAEVTGTVVDVTGAVIPGATITLHEFLTRKSRTAHTNAAGQFSLNALPAARYQVQISAPGFELLSRDFAVQPRDRAILSIALSVGSATETVTVDAVAMGGPIAMHGVMKDRVFEAPAPAPPMAQNFVVNANAAVATLAVQGRSFAAALKTPSPEAPHVRSYFPEALYINPEIITDAKGNANISIPIADSITTWRMAMLASTPSGALGTGTSSLKVFQYFFVDVDLPVTLTQGDRVSIPVAIYDYSGAPGQVSLKLQPEAWFSLDNDTSEKNVSVESGRVGASQFNLNANRVGKFKLTLNAHMNGTAGRDDIVVREIEVVPNGREQNLVFNGRLENSAQHDLHFPAASIPDATSIFVRLYPGPLSQVIEGMDSILRMPGGCFEQTSSSTYPNVLALDYMKRTKKLTPEVHAKAEGYIANGYQRLLTFEVPGGGFSWFGQAPANKILTAYGLMEFNDMSKVSDVDPKLIERTRDWLARQQQPDGSWKPDTSFINEGATNRYNSDILRITAYIAWSLVNTGYQGPAIEKARHFIESNSTSKPDTYTLAIIANFAVDYGKDRDFTRRSMQALIDARTEKDDQISWNLEKTGEETGVHSTGSSATIETTGLATQALLKWGQASDTVRKALNFISSKKQASGNWGTTQATIMALRSLLLASQLSTSDVRGTLQVLLDGEPVETLKLTPENNDLLHQFVFKGIDTEKNTTVQLKFEGTGGLAYQIVGRYFTPWDERPVAEPLSIDVAYDRTKLSQNDIATATVTVRNNLPKAANMVMVDLGIPPGFDLLSEDLQSLQEKTAGAKTGRLEKFSLTATQAILYFNALAPKQTVALSFRLHAKYPIRAHTFQSRVYEYYDPDVNSTARPVRLEVTER